MFSIVATCSCPDITLSSKSYVTLSATNYTTAQVMCDDNNRTKVINTALTVVVATLTVALIVTIIVIIFLIRRNFKQLHLQ